MQRIDDSKKSKTDDEKKLDDVSESKKIPKNDNDEISVQITVPSDGGWGRVVLFTAFIIFFINDGIMFTYGNVINSYRMSEGFNLPVAALINSITVSTYYCSGPLVAGLINRFGFRFCAMFGAIISAFANLSATVIGTYASFIVFSGIIAGFGYSLANMSAIIILGFYYQKFRAVASTVAITGSSAGIFLFGFVYGRTAELVGWRIILLLQSSILALEYFAASTFRPLLSVRVAQTPKPTETSDIKPPASHVKTKVNSRKSSIYSQGSNSTKPHGYGLFKTPSNSNYPTVAEILHEPHENSSTDDSTPGPSNEGATKLRLIFNNPDEEFHHNEIEKVKSITAKTHARYNDGKSLKPDNLSVQTIDMTIESEVCVSPKKRGFWKSLFHWEPHVEESRPLYRDDAFYFGSTKDLVDSKNLEIDEALEYQLEVSRAAPRSDLNQHKGVFTTAFCRVLATMLDPSPLKWKSFLLICFGIFFIYLGYLIPLIYVANRGSELNLSCFYTTFVSCIGFAGVFGRIVIGYLALKIDPIAITAVLYLIAGLSTLISCFVSSVALQLLYCLIYGFVTSGTTTIRSLYLVKLYGLDHLTNCTGIIVIFQGFGCLLSSPIGGILAEALNYNAAFIFSSVCFFIGSLCYFSLYAIVVQKIKKENERI